MTGESVTITKEEYLELLLAQIELRMLHYAGVDNWDWYGDALNPDGEPDFVELKNEAVERVNVMTVAGPVRRE